MAKPSGSELKLLRCVWRAPRLSAREIHEAAGGDDLWSFSTTRKMLDRLVEKGLVTVEFLHGAKTFAAAEPKLRTLARLIRDFARDVLDVTEPIPVATFVRSKHIDPDETEELQALLKQLSREKGSGDAP